MYTTIQYKLGLSVELHISTNQESCSLDS